MNILILKLCLVFLVIIAILWMKRPLFLAISGGLAGAVLLYGIRLQDALLIMGKSLVSKDTITVVLSFYFITFLQRMLERRSRLKQAEESLNGLFNNRRINASAAPAVIGLLPSAGAMTICAEIVRSSCEDYLSNEDMTAVTSFYRHIPECFLPTYSSILIALGRVRDRGRGVCGGHAPIGGSAVFYRLSFLPAQGAKTYRDGFGRRQEGGC